MGYKVLKKLQICSGEFHFEICFTLEHLKHKHNFLSLKMQKDKNITRLTFVNF